MIKSLRLFLLVWVFVFCGCFASQGGGETFQGPITKFIGKSQIVPIPSLLAQAVTTCAKGQTTGNATAFLEYNFWASVCTGAVQQDQQLQLGIVGQINQQVCGWLGWSNGTSWQLLAGVSPTAPALAECPATPTPLPTPSPAPTASAQ